MLAVVVAVVTGKMLLEMELVEMVELAVEALEVLVNLK